MHIHTGERRRVTLGASKPTISPDAALASAAEVKIDAPIERVWTVLYGDRAVAGVEPGREVGFDRGSAEEGSIFRWKAGPGTIVSRIERLDRPRLVAWSGKTLGIRALHIWRLTDEQGTTRVRTEESYDGLVARLLRPALRKTLENALTKGARYLKAEAEKDSPSSP